MKRAAGGFTLIEMLGVIAIMALLSAAAVVMLNGPRHAADLQDSIDQIVQADASARTLARESGRPVTLAIGLSEGNLVRSDATAETTLGNIAGDVKIERVRLGSVNTDFGSVKIAFSQTGCSPSYGLRLATSAGQTQWIVFAGLTGQMLKVSDEDIDTIFQEVSGSNGADAR